MNQSTRKILAGVLSLAMVLTMVAGVAVSANAQTTASYARSLTVGSRGTDVTALQTMLNAGGFLKVSPTGYFGSLTKAALGAWQASVGISPAAGYFGPITRAYIANMGGVVGGNNGCPAGAIYNPTTGVKCSGGSPIGGTLDNTDGSLTASLSSYASDVTIKKGESKNMVAVKLQATAGKVAVTRFDARVNDRPWLFFSKFTLKDSDGNVIATKALNGPSDVTEITVGSDYLIRFDGINYVVSPGSDKILVVEGTLHTTSDKITNNDTVIVSVPTGAIRTMNGKGYTDSLGLGTVATAGTSGRTITFTTSGSTGTVAARTSSATPLPRIQPTSTSGQTNDVVIGAFDLRSENQSSTINSLIFGVGVGGTHAQSTVFKSIRLTDGTNTWTADSIATSTTFTNLNISLPQDSWKTLTLRADVADQDEFTSGTIASTSLLNTQNNVIGVDANFNTATSSANNTAASNNVTFLANAVSVSNISVSSQLVDNGSSAATKATAKYTFTLTNSGNNDVYVSALPGAFVATTTTGTASTTLTAVTTSPATDSGDLADTYYIIRSGQSRTFTLEGIMSNTGLAQGLQIGKITTIYFDDDTTGLQESSINFGLENLRISNVL